MRNFEKITRKSARRFDDEFKVKVSKPHKVKRKEFNKRDWVEII